MKNKNWPAYEVNLRLLSGAVGAGRDLFLVGSFGGFGGNFCSAHLDFDEAKQQVTELSKISENEYSIYRLKILL